MCLDKLAFVGDAKDGLLLGVRDPAWEGIGIRLGVFDAFTGTDVVGEVLRLFAGESAMDDTGNFQIAFMISVTIYTSISRNEAHNELLERTVDHKVNVA